MTAERARTAGQFQRQLMELVEALAVDYEQHLGIRGVVLAVSQARAATAPAGSSVMSIATVERHARALLNDLMSRTPADERVADAEERSTFARNS